MVSRLVLVTGPPAAGKSTLAQPLARLLGYPLLAKDALKEGIDDIVHPDVRDQAWSELVGRTTFDLMWTLAPYFPELVLEANLYPTKFGHRESVERLNPRPVEVFCDCPLEECHRRYDLRGADRHPVHVQATLPADRFLDWAGPLGIGQVIRIDTTQPVDVERLAAQVRDALEGLQRAG